MKDSFTIHSGHFMDSRIHEDKDDLIEDDYEVSTHGFKTRGHDFSQAKEESTQTYKFGPKSTSTLSIDTSLTKLFECMTLAYSGKITSPKWKPFRGMHLSTKDKVRLNNIIWREWHRQYIFQKSSVVCQFAIPLSDDIHSKPEAVVMEGKYWKRRLDTVMNEYKKWRQYYRDKILQTMLVASHLSICSTYMSEEALLERLKDITALPSGVRQRSTCHGQLDDNKMDVDFTDQLFTCLSQQALPSPDPHEVTQFGQGLCSDLIQPGLVQLLPSLDNFMDMDCVQEFLGMSKPSSTSTMSVSSTQLMSELQPPTGGPQIHGLLKNGPDSPLSSACHSTANTNLQSISWDSLPHSGGATTHTAPPDPASYTTIDDMLFSSPEPDSGLFLDPSGEVMEGLGMDLDVHPSEKAISMSVSHTTVLQQLMQVSETVNSADLGLTLPDVSSQLLSSTQRSSLTAQPSSVGTVNVGSARNVNRGSHVTPVSAPTVFPVQRTVPLTAAANPPRVSAKRNVAGQQGKSASVSIKPRPVAPSPAPLSPAAAAVPLQASSAKSASPSPSLRNSCLARLLQDGAYSGTLIEVEGGGSSSLLNLKPPSSNVHRGRPSVPTCASPGSASAPTHLLSGIAPVQASSTPASSSLTPACASSVLAPALSASIAPAQALSVLAPANALSASTPAASALSLAAVLEHASSVLAAPASTLPVLLSANASSGTVPAQLLSILAPANASPVFAPANASSATTPANASSTTTPANASSTTTPANASSATTPANASSATTSANASTTTVPAQILSVTAPADSSSMSAPLRRHGGGRQARPQDTDQGSGMDFPARVLMAAASSMLGVAPCSVANMAPLSTASTLPTLLPRDTKYVFTSRPQSKSPFSMTLRLQPASSASATSPAGQTISMEEDVSASSPTGAPRECLSARSSMNERFSQSRQISHRSAEQKRRGSLKSSLELLPKLVPALASNLKISEAIKLQKTAEHIRKVKAEIEAMRKEDQILKGEIQILSDGISQVQCQLPETGVPVTRQRMTHMNDMFDRYVQQRTKQDWKFWIFSSIMRDMFDTYNSTVSTATVAELYHTLNVWLDQHCTLTALRPVTVKAMTHLCTSTSILTRPGSVQEQALQAVSKASNSDGQNRRGSV